MSEIRLYDGPAPGSEGWTHEERSFDSGLFGTAVVTNVVVPTLTPVLPASGSANGAAVIVAPGGGFHALSIESEGTAVARRLSEHGIAAFVLKYRLVETGTDGPQEMAAKAAADLDGLFADMARITPLAVADGEAAMRCARSHAAEFGIDAGRVGFMGFSAGGRVAVGVAHTNDPGARPDFVAPIYASIRDADLVSPPAGSGPMFLVAATDDELGLARDSLVLYDHWRRQRLPVELHMYARGGHGFGMRRQHLPSDTWIDRFLDWFDASGLDAAVTNSEK